MFLALQILSQLQPINRLFLVIKATLFLKIWFNTELYYTIRSFKTEGILVCCYTMDLEGSDLKKFRNLKKRKFLDKFEYLDILFLNSSQQAVNLK